MELPTIAKSAYATHAYDPSAAFLAAQGISLPDTAAGLNPAWKQEHLQKAHEYLNDPNRHFQLPKTPALHPKEKTMPSARIVRVFIVDPNENIPLEKRVIYKSEEQLTDLTDQELFFEANPAALLATHNQYRTTVLDQKKAQAIGMDRGNVNLEPARIRDLKMVVVDVAAF